MKILSFGASYSENSINQMFADYTARFFKNDQVEILRINQYELPIFIANDQQVKNPPTAVIQFIDKILSHDLIIISLAEHNGSYTAAFKNIFDWSSTINGKIFEGKKLILLATSPGNRGGQSVLDQALRRFPYHGAEIVGHFSLPNFEEHFNRENMTLEGEWAKKIESFLEHIENLGEF